MTDKNLTSYHPRNDFVLLQLIKVDSLKGVKLPDISPDAASWFVVEAGPDVKDLKTGDQVMVIGSMNEDIARLPGLAGMTGLHVTKQHNIILKVEVNGDGGEPAVNPPAPETVCEPPPGYTVETVCEPPPGYTVTDEDGSTW